jgi:hypothetical protein
LKFIQGDIKKRNPNPDLIENHVGRSSTDELGERDICRHMVEHKTLLPEFDLFADSLTKSEKAAVLQWLNVGYDLIRNYELSGNIPQGFTELQVSSLVEDFTKAIQKAVVCTQTVYRGLSAGNWRPGSIRFLRELVSGAECFTFVSHDSATFCEAMGYSFCRTTNEDEERDLSVLLRISPRTARYLAPFKHSTCNEFEVVLLKGARYHRTVACRIDAERPGQEFWAVDIREL